MRLSPRSPDRYPSLVSEDCSAPSVQFIIGDIDSLIPTLRIILRYRLEMVAQLQNENRHDSLTKDPTGRCITSVHPTIEYFGLLLGRPRHTHDTHHGFDLTSIATAPLSGRLHPHTTERVVLQLFSQSSDPTKSAWTQEANNFVRLNDR